MTIDKEKLVELLVDKTGLDASQVEEQISELVKRIHQAAEEGKSFEVENLGIFSIRDEELHFEPSDRLETEINQKYAGMEPLELMGAYGEEKDKEEAEEDGEEEIPADEPVGEGTEEDETGEDEVEEDVWGVEEESSLADQLSAARSEKEEEESSAEPGTSEEIEEPEEEPEEQEKAEAQEETEEQEEPSKPPSFLFDYEAEGEETVEEELGSERDEPEEVFASEEEPVGKETVEKETAKEPVTAGEGTSGHDESDPIGKMLTIFAVVLAIGVGGWFLYDAGVFDTVTGSSETQNEQQATAGGSQQVNVPGPDREASAAGDRQESEEDDRPGISDSQTEQTGGDEVSPSDDRDQAGADSQNRYGLKGETVDEANGGYTIVVHSFQNERLANRKKSDFGEDGYRTLLLRAEVNGVAYWRVGIGQFETIQDAQDAAKSLPAPLNNRNFIKRIQ